MKNSNVNSGNKNKSSMSRTVPYSLKGKTVTVYRGGPESATGKILSVKPDHLALYSEDGVVIYYQAEHVKSISENTLESNSQNNNQQDEEVEFFEANSFAEVVNNFINMTVQVNQGGPEAKYGDLLEVGNDHIILSTEDDGVVYYNIHHVKSIKEYQSDDDDSDDNSNEKNAKQNKTKSNGNAMALNQEIAPEFIKEANFNNIFKNMTHSWVSINRGGPEAVEGILVEDTDGFFTLINNQELYRIHPYHVRNISSGTKGGNSQNNDDSEENQDQTNENQNESSSNNRSSSDGRSKRGSRNRSSGRNSRRSGRRSARRTREHVVNTVNYVWRARS